MRRLAVPVALLFSLVGVGLAVAAGSSRGTQGGSEPQYWIDGARPTRVEGQVYLEGEGCVPYSPQRPDVKICGEVPTDFVPPPEPAYDAEVCQQAIAYYSELRANYAASGASESQVDATHPEIDPASCLVERLAEANRPGADYMVSFRRADATGNVQVPLDVG
jgi:hypothetical protein